MNKAELPAHYVDIVVDGKVFAPMVDEKKALGHLIVPCIPFLDYMSDSAIKEWILNSCDMVDEVNDDRDKRLKSRIRKVRNKLTDREYDHLALEYIATNLYLSSAGLGPVFGRIKRKRKI